MADSQTSNEFTDEETAFMRHVRFSELSGRIRSDEMVEGVATESPPDLSWQAQKGSETTSTR